MSNKTSKIFCVLYVVVTLFFAAAIFVLPRTEFSSEENRMLAEPPKLTSDTLISGDFAHGVSDFCADQFPFRTKLLRLNSAYSLALGKLENGGVMKGKNGNLIKRLELYNIDKLDTNLATIKNLRKYAEDRGGISVFLCPPRAADVLSDFCPLPFLPDTELWQKIEDENALCVTDLLKEKANAGEYVFYRTDHHWTTLGAYYAYAALGEKIGYTPYPISAFTPTEVCSDFLGSSYSASLLQGVTADSIISMRYDSDTNVKVTDMNTYEVFGMYDDDALQKVSKYDYFLGGNKAYLRIENGDKPRLIIIKDSFANSLVPFLARHFNIDLIDPRYLRTSLSELLETLYEGTEKPPLLIVYNPETLYTEAGLKNFAIFSQSP